jgi:GNAT superfamily N-acetyltransferase
MVVMPEWQGAGIGMRFLNTLMEREITGDGPFGDRAKVGYFHTSHPGLCAALRRDPRWEQVSAVMHGSNRGRSRSSLARTSKSTIVKQGGQAGYGGHFRAVQGFRYRGEAWATAKA